MDTTSSIPIVNTSTVSTKVPFTFDSSYKGDDITKRAAEIIGLNDLSSWSVVDSDENKALVHYRDDADKAVYGHLRGVLLDLENGDVIADSFGYTPTAVALELKSTDNILSVKDTNGCVHDFTLDNVIIKKVFEGVVIRVIWHNSKLYRITHRKINPVRSRWGSAKSFISMYEEAGGPTAEQLFDTSKPYSSTCYDFLVVDQCLLVGTRQRVNVPYIIFLAKREMDIKRPVDQVAIGNPTFETTKEMTGSVTKSVIHDPPSLTLEEANAHLKFGYYDEFTVQDCRQLTGEAVIIYSQQGSVITDIVKVHSPAYDWRVCLRGNNPNIANQFYTLLNTVYKDINEDSAWALFTKRYILFPLYDEDALKQLYNDFNGILTIPEGPVNKSLYLNRDNRIYLLWMNYVLSLPMHLQGAGLNILSQFKTDRNNLVYWIQTLEASTDNIKALNLSTRLETIILSARNLSRSRVQESSNYTMNGARIKLPVLIKSTIRNLIHKENGSSLYSLVRQMKEANKEVNI